MKNKNIRLFCLLFAGMLIIASCKKDSQNIFNMFNDVNVTYHGDHPFSVTDYKLVNDGDSVYIDYTITSAKEDIYTVTVEVVGVVGNNGQNPVRTNNLVTNDSERRSYSRTLKLKAQRDGKTSYRIYALNEFGTYIGDGYKKVTVEVNPSYSLIANRRVYAPDTAAKVNASFYSILRGEAISYTNGQANSKDIDFGIWRREDTRPAHLGQYIYNYYSMSAPTNPFPLYDISTWTKRETLFSNPIANATNTFLLNLISSSLIETGAKGQNLNVRSTNFATWQAGLVAGSMIYFLTPEGKYGAILVNASSKDYEDRPFLNISVKIQK